MDILAIMCLGILIGRFAFMRRMKKKNEYMSLLCTFVLIFSMGVMLGQKENFFEELLSLGITSFLFFLIPTILSIALVYFLTQRFMRNNQPNAAEGSEEI